MILADTNILSTFAKVDQLSLLFLLFADYRLGVVPAVYEEIWAGTEKGYSDLQAVIELVQRGQIELVIPTVLEIFQKGGLPGSLDAGERETLTVAQARGYAILTNEAQVRNWCQRNAIEYWDLPGILRTLWKTNLLTKEQVQRLLELIEAKDRVLFKNKDRILQE